MSLQVHTRSNSLSSESHVPLPSPLARSTSPAVLRTPSETSEHTAAPRLPLPPSLAPPLQVDLLAHTHRALYNVNASQNQGSAQPLPCL